MHGIFCECSQNIYFVLWHVSPSGSTIWEASIARGDRQELSPLKSLLTRVADTDSRQKIGLP